jgi:acyl-coenzyme A thioesterase PaaI-like protein
VISYLVDNAITFAAGAVLGPDVVTGGFTLDYLTPTSGPVLRAQASVCRAGSKKAVMRCDLHAVQADDSCTLVAVGQGRAQVRRS